MLKYEKYSEDGTKFYFYVDCLQKHIDRRMLLDLFTPCQHSVFSDVPKELRKANFIALTGKADEIGPLLEYNVVHVPQDDTEYEYCSVTDPSSKLASYGIIRIPSRDDTLILCRLSDDANLAPFAMDDKFYLESDMISNYKGEPVLTDAGKFFCNKILLADPFGDLIPYINDTFDLGKIDDMVAKLIINDQAGREQYNRYMNNGFWFGFDGSIATSAWTMKSITTDPNLPKRRAELLEKYKDSIAKDPTVALKIEKELIEMDKAYLKGDPAEPYYAVTAGKSYGEARKKMYGIFGLGVAFGKGKGEYCFTGHSLEDGWDIKDVAVVANDVRRGAYGRGIETAKGGEQTKLVLRMFQEVKMEQGDCGTKRGLLVKLTKKNASSYYGRYLMDGKTILSADNIDKYIDKEIEIRSPMFCISKNYCAKCCGEFFSKLDAENIGLQSLAVCSTFLSIAMATMHASSLKTTRLKDIDRFFIQPHTQK